MMPTIEIVRLDEMSDYYILTSIYDGVSSTVKRTDRFGFNRGEVIKRLTHTALIDDTESQSLHLVDDSTSYKNVSGSIAYAVVTVKVSGTPAPKRKFKIYSSPTDNTPAGAPIFDSENFVLASNDFDNAGDKSTAYLLPIQDDHFIILENLTGTASREILVDNITQNFETFVIEKIP